MAAKDLIHDAVKNALINDGWTITHDPYTIQYGSDTLYADLAAELPFAAEQNGRKIVVEVKSFTGYSVIQDFKEALGQYLIYLRLLSRIAPEYKLYLAVSTMAYHYDLERATIRLIMDDYEVSLLVVDLSTEKVAEWIR